MKILIADVPYYISWRYNQVIKQKGAIITIGRNTTCIIQTSNQDVLIQRSVSCLNEDSVPKSKDRKASLNKVLHAYTALTKEQRKLIWNTYIQSQHGNVSDNKHTVKQILSFIAGLDAEQKERIKNKLVPQQNSTKIVQMETLETEVAVLG